MYAPAYERVKQRTPFGTNYDTYIAGADPGPPGSPPFGGHPNFKKRGNHVCECAPYYHLP